MKPRRRLPETEALVQDVLRVLRQGGICDNFDIRQRLPRRWDGLESSRLSGVLAGMRSRDEVVRYGTRSCYRYEATRAPEPCPVVSLDDYRKRRAG